MPFYAYSPAFRDSKLYKSSGLYVVTAPFLEEHREELERFLDPGAALTGQFPLAASPMQDT